MALLCFLLCFCTLAEEVTENLIDIMAGLICFFLGIAVVFLLGFFWGNGSPLPSSRLENNNIYKTIAIVPKREMDPEEENSFYYLLLENQGGKTRLFSYDSEPPQADYVKVRTENGKRILSAFPSSNNP